jgi:hypothetical protein
MPEQTTTAPCAPSLTLTVRLDTDEDAALRENARQSRMAIPDYSRHVLICGTIVTRERARLPFALRRALERIGVNLRQLRELDGDELLRAYVWRVHGRVAGLLRVELDAFLAEKGMEDAPGRTRDVVRAVRLTADQREVVEALARRCGMTWSAYGREMLARGQVTVFADRETDFARIDELKALGLKINEATHTANIHKRLPDALPHLLARLEPLLDLISRD